MIILTQQHINIWRCGAG